MKNVLLFIASYGVGLSPFFVPSHWLVYDAMIVFFYIDFVLKTKNNTGYAIASTVLPMGMTSGLLLIWFFKMLSDSDFILYFYTISLFFLPYFRIQSNKSKLTMRALQSIIYLIVPFIIFFVFGIFLNFNNLELTIIWSFFISKFMFSYFKSVWLPILQWCLSFLLLFPIQAFHVIDYAFYSSLFFFTLFLEKKIKKKKAA